MASSTPSRRDVFTAVLPAVSAEDRDRLELAREDYAELAADLQEHCSEGDARRYVRALQLEDAVDALSRAKGVRAAWLRRRCRRALRTERPWRIGFERSRLGHDAPLAIAFREERRSGGLRAAAVWIGIGIALTAAVLVARSFWWHTENMVDAGAHLLRGSPDETRRAIIDAEADLARTKDPARQGQLHGLLGDQYLGLAEYWADQGVQERCRECQLLASEHYQQGAQRGDAFSHLALGQDAHARDDLRTAIDHFREAYQLAEGRNEYRTLRLQVAYRLHAALVALWFKTGCRIGPLVTQASAVETQARSLATSLRYYDELSWIGYNGACVRAALIRRGLLDASSGEEVIASLREAMETAPEDTQKALARLLLEDEDFSVLRKYESFEALTNWARELIASTPGHEGH